MIPEYIQMCADVWSFVLGISILTCYCVSILLTLSLNWNTKPWETAFVSRSISHANLTKVVLVMWFHLCLFPNRSKVHSSGAELIQSDTIPADTLSEYGVIIGLRHMPFWLWIIIVPSGGERIKQLSRWAFRNELFPCTADRKLLKHMWNSRNKENWFVFSIRF